MMGSCWRFGCLVLIVSLSQCCVGRQVTWSKSNPSLTTTGLVDVAFGAGKYVLVGNAFQYFMAPEVFTSTDAKHWERVQLPHSPSANVDDFEILFVAGKGFYIFDSNTTVWTSPDGASWNVGQTNMLVYDVSYGNGQFVGAFETTVVFSPDGFHWTANQPAGLYSAGVVFTAGYFVASEVGPSFSSVIPVYLSADGKTWTRHNVTRLTEGSTFAGVYPSGSNTIAVVVMAQNDTTLQWIGQFLSSGDGGATWQLQSTFGFVYDLLYVNGNYLARLNSGQRIVSTDGGQTWENFTNSDAVPAEVLNIVYTGNTYFTLGELGFIATASAINGPWEVFDEGIEGAFVGLTTFDDHFVLLAANDNYGFEGISYASKDGAKWRQFGNESYTFCCPFEANGLLYLQQGAYIGGGIVVASTPDLVAFDYVTVTPPNEAAVGQVSSVGAYFYVTTVEEMLINFQQYYQSTTFFSSSLVGPWTSLGTVGPFRIAIYEQLVLFNGFYVRLGNQNMTSATAISGPYKPYLPALQDVSTIATFGNLLFIALYGAFDGNTTTFVVVNGQGTATTVTLPTGAAKVVCYDAGVYYALGATAPVLASSPDGYKWTTVNTPSDAITGQLFAGFMAKNKVLVGSTAETILYYGKA